MTCTSSRWISPSNSGYVMGISWEPYMYIYMCVCYINICYIYIYSIWYIYMLYIYILYGIYICYIYMLYIYVIYICYIYILSYIYTRQMPGFCQEPQPRQATHQHHHHHHQNHHQTLVEDLQNEDRSLTGVEKLNSY